MVLGMGYGELLDYDNIAFGTDDGDVVDITYCIDTGALLGFDG